MLARLMGLKTVSPARLHHLMRDEGVTVIDVNHARSWITARVTGARNLDPDRFDSSNLPPDRDAMVVFYCSNFLCMKAPRAARRAAAMGYQNVHVMSAGIKGWMDAALPTESGEAFTATRSRT